MHSVRHHRFLGKAVRNVKTSKSQFGKKKSRLPTNAIKHTTISTYKQISEKCLKDSWEMVYCNCVQRNLQTPQELQKQNSPIFAFIHSWVNCL